MNFYGWLFTGLLTFGGSAYFVFGALHAAKSISTQEALLLGIYFIFVGHFGVILHNYLARVAAKLDAQDPEQHDPTGG